MTVSFEEALAYAQSQRSDEAWVGMRPRERTAAIYAALRHLDLQAAQIEATRQKSARRNSRLSRKGDQPGDVRRARPAIPP